GPVRARLIQHPAVSPDGRAVAFSALGRVYTMELVQNARPRALSPEGQEAFQPSWSPDGRSIAYVTWNAGDAGQVWTIGMHGGEPRAATAVAAYYTSPTFTPDAKSIVALRSSNSERMHTYMEWGPLREADLVSIAPHGGDVRVLARASIGGTPHFSADRSE